MFEGEFTFARIYYIQKRAQGALFRLGVQITRRLRCVNHVTVFFPRPEPLCQGETGNFVVNVVTCPILRPGRDSVLP